MDRDTVTTKRASTVLVLQQTVHEKAPPHHLSSEEVNPPPSSTRARINLENSSTKQHYTVLSENPTPCCARKGEIQHSHCKAQPGAGAVGKPAQSSLCHVNQGRSSRDPRASCTSGLTRGGEEAWGLCQDRQHHPAPPSTPTANPGQQSWETHQCLLWWQPGKWRCSHLPSSLEVS